jgi:hypothetical protein
LQLLNYRAHIIHVQTSVLASLDDYAGLTLTSTFIIIIIYQLIIIYSKVLHFIRLGHRVVVHYYSSSVSIQNEESLL